MKENGQRKQILCSCLFRKKCPLMLVCLFVVIVIMSEKDVFRQWICTALLANVKKQLSVIYVSFEKNAEMTL